MTMLQGRDHVCFTDKKADFAEIKLPKVTQLAKQKS
jgi:hypothetical protein